MLPQIQMLSGVRKGALSPSNLVDQVRAWDELCKEYSGDELDNRVLTRGDFPRAHDASPEALRAMEIVPVVGLGLSVLVFGPFGFHGFALFWCFVKGVSCILHLLRSVELSVLSGIGAVWLPPSARPGPRMEEASTPSVVGRLYRYVFSVKRTSRWSVPITMVVNWLKAEPAGDEDETGIRDVQAMDPGWAPEPLNLLAETNFEFFSLSEHSWYRSASRVLYFHCAIPYLMGGVIRALVLLHVISIWLHPLNPLTHLLTLSILALGVWSRGGLFLFHEHVLIDGKTVAQFDDLSGDYYDSMEFVGQRLASLALSSAIFLGCFIAAQWHPLPYLFCAIESYLLLGALVDRGTVLTLRAFSISMSFPIFLFVAAEIAAGGQFNWAYVNWIPSAAVALAVAFFELGAIGLVMMLYAGARLYLLDADDMSSPEDKHD